MIRASVSGRGGLPRRGPPAVPLEALAVRVLSRELLGLVSCCKRAWGVAGHLPRQAFASRSWVTVTVTVTVTVRVMVDDASGDTFGDSSGPLAERLDLPNEPFHAVVVDHDRRCGADQPCMPLPADQAAPC